MLLCRSIVCLAAGCAGVVSGASATAARMGIDAVCFFSLLCGVVWKCLSVVYLELTQQWVWNCDCRFQPVFRTLHGLSQQREAFIFLYRIQNPSETLQAACQFASQKLQFIFGYQSYGKVRSLSSFIGIFNLFLK